MRKVDKFLYYEEIDDQKQDPFERALAYMAIAVIVVVCLAAIWAAFV